MRGGQSHQRLLRELAGAVARQAGDHDQWPRQEHRIDALAQRLGKRAASSCGATTQAATRATPVWEPRASSTWKNAPSSTPRNRVQLVVEVGERAALAGDVHEVRLAAVQEEAVPAGHLEHIAHAAWAARHGRRPPRHRSPRIVKCTPGHSCHSGVCVGRRVAICPVSVEP